MLRVPSPSPFPMASDSVSAYLIALYPAIHASRIKDAVRRTLAELGGNASHGQIKALAARKLVGLV